MISKRFGSVLLLLMLGALLVGCSMASVSAESRPTTPTPRPAISDVTAQAYVFPLRSVDLAFKRGGRLAQVLVQEGDSVAAGQTLLRLEDADLRAAVAGAEATLARAQAQLAGALAGATLAQAAQAEAVVARAEAALAQVQAGATQEQIAVAEARVATLQAQLANVLAGTRSESIAASAAALSQAEAAVRVAQAQYDKVAGSPDAGASLQSLDLQQATQELEAARANHEALLRGPTAGEIAVLRAQLAEGLAALSQTRAGPTPAQVAAAEATLAEARAALAYVNAGSTPAEVAASKASVAEAQAALDQARAALDDAELRAPFAGAIGAMSLEAGQYVAPGAPIVALADLSGWKLQTDNLTETEVVRVSVGQSVRVGVDALPGEWLDGTVTRIKPRSDTKAGDVTYTVEIALSRPDPRLRWGMTTSVEFGAVE